MPQVRSLAATAAPAKRAPAPLDTFTPASGGNVNEALLGISKSVGTTPETALASLGPGERKLYDQMAADDPKQAQAYLVQAAMQNLKLIAEILSNVSKTRSEIAMTFARNIRG